MGGIFIGIGLISGSKTVKGEWAFRPASASPIPLIVGMYFVTEAPSSLMRTEYTAWHAFLQGRFYRVCSYIGAAVFSASGSVEINRQSWCVVIRRYVAEGKIGTTGR